MYEGHLPNGEGVQKHSAGDIYPVVIVHYGDGTARWVDQRRGLASARMGADLDISVYQKVESSARAYMEIRDSTVYITRRLMRGHYLEFLQEFQS